MAKNDLEDKANVIRTKHGEEALRKIGNLFYENGFNLAGKLLGGLVLYGAGKLLLGDYASIAGAYLGLSSTYSLVNREVMIALPSFNRKNEEKTDKKDASKKDEDERP